MADNVTAIPVIAAIGASASLKRLEPEGQIPALKPKFKLRQYPAAYNWAAATPAGLGSRRTSAIIVQMHLASRTAG